MSEETKHSLLKNFFSGYFHEDWPCEAESPEAVVSGYVRTARLSDVHALGAAIIDYSKNFTNDAELEDNLFAELGCYYRPSIEGISAKLWLERIASQLNESSLGK